jgi:bla regulator protein blaR1
MLTLALRKNAAHVRYWVWFIASAKLLVPFSLLVGLGSLAPWRAPAPAVRTAWAAAAEGFSQPFNILPTTAIQVDATSSAAGHGYIVAACWTVWLLGFAAIAACWLVRWRRADALRRSASLVNNLEFAVPVMSVRGLVEPGVFGIFRPVLLMPEGIAEHLEPAQFDAILAHEACHLRRRDNLTAAVHMFVQAIFWFHPLVWWLGARLIDERERACDEDVLRFGSAPGVYAEGILKVCKLYVESRLACVAGVTGADLKKRIEAIMRNRGALRLDFTRKATLAFAGAAALALPIAMGMMHPPFIRAQSTSSGQKGLTFDAASVKPTTVPDGVFLGENRQRGSRKGSGTQIPRNTGGPGTEDPGRIHYGLISLKELLKLGWPSYYDIEGPGWLASQVVTVDATMPPATTKEQFQEMLRNLITERFGLKYHAETKDVAGYALIVAKSGPRIKESADQSDAEFARPAEPTRSGPDGFPVLPPSPGKLMVNFGKGDRARDIGQEVTMKDLARSLGRTLKTTVMDETGLPAKYDYILTYATEGPPSQTLEPLSDISEHYNRNLA